jgi:hypothetical protein
MPHLHENRFREFLRTTRQWMYLQDMKREGVEESSTVAGCSLALHCPACPRMNVNYGVEDVGQDEE